MKSLKPNFFYQLTITFLQAAVPIITFPYVSRTLGPDNIGKINFIDYIIQFLLTAAAFGIPMYGAREVSRLHQNKIAVRKLISELACVHLFMTLVSLALFAIMLYFSPSVFQQKELVILAMINLVANAFTLDWMIQGLEDFAFVSRRTIIIRLLVVLALFLFIHHEQDFALYYSFLVVGSILIILSDLLYAYRKGFSFIRPSNLWRHVRPLSIFFLTTAAISVYLYVDTFILGLIAGSLAVGFYTTALKTVKLSQNFVNDLGGVLLPRISYLYEAKEDLEIKRLMNKSLLYVLTLAIPLSIFFFFAAPEIVFVLAGNKYMPSVQVLRILAPLPVVIGLSNVFVIQVLIPFKKEGAMLLVTLAGSIVSIALCLILAPTYKHLGAAWACIAAETTVTGSAFLFARKLNQFRLTLFQWLPIVITSLLFIPLINVSRQLFSTHLNVLVGSATICAGTYVVLQQLFFSNIIIKETINFAIALITGTFKK